PFQIQVLPVPPLKCPLGTIQFHINWAKKLGDRSLLPAPLRSPDLERRRKASSNDFAGNPSANRTNQEACNEIWNVNRHLLAPRGLKRVFRPRGFCQPHASVITNRELTTGCLSVILFGRPVFSHRVVAEGHAFRPML